MPAQTRMDWTAESIAELQELKAEGLTDPQIAIRLGCSEYAVYRKLRRLRMNAEQIERERTTRRQWDSKHRDRRGYVKLGGRPIDEWLARDRDQRLLAPRDTTSLLMGDPPKGFSALDRRDEGLLDNAMRTKIAASLSACDER